MSVAALSRVEIADYVAALFFVYSVLVICNVILVWIGQFRPIPYNLALRAVTGFVEESTDPYLNLFRSWVPRIGPLDISPIIAIIVLSVAGAIVAGLIRG